MSVKDIEAMLSNAKRVDSQREREFAHPRTYEQNGNGGAHPKSEADTRSLVKPIIFRTLADIVAEKRETRWLIQKVLEREVLAVLAGPRSTFKSFIGLDWMMHIALTGEPVVILSGEGAGLDRRAGAWMRTFAPTVDLASLPIVALERAVNLNVPETLNAVADACLALPRPPVAALIDTLSKFSPGMKENDNGEVSAFLAGLSDGLRDRLHCTVLAVAHTGHAEIGRPRGAYALMANPDAEYIVERPNPAAMTVTVSRERFKDTPAMPPLAYTARVVDLGRPDKYGEAVTSLVLDATDAPVPTIKRAGIGKNQERATTALREWVRTNPGNLYLSSIDLRGMLKVQGIKDSNRRGEAIDYLTNIRALNPAAGGHTVNPDALL